MLVLVGTFETFDDAQARACGANGHLKKPFDSQELFRLVERLIAENARQAPAPPVMAAAPVDPFAAAPAFAMPSPPAFAPVQPAAAQPLPSPAFLPPVASVPAPAPPALVSAPPVAAPAAPEFAFSLSPVAASPAEPTRVAAPAVPAPVEAPSAPLPNVDTRPTAARQVESVPADAGGGLTDADIDRIARRVAELIGEKAVKEIAWEVVPDLAEVVIRERIRELESQVQ